jgi:hypothetical protein
MNEGFRVTRVMLRLRVKFCLSTLVELVGVSFAVSESVTEKSGHLQELSAT